LFFLPLRCCCSLSVSALKLYQIVFLNNYSALCSSISIGRKFQIKLRRRNSSPSSPSPIPPAINCVCGWLLRLVVSAVLLNHVTLVRSHSYMYVHMYVSISMYAQSTSSGPCHIHMSQFIISFKTISLSLHYITASHQTRRKLNCFPAAL
jgi:hypothetical protein